MNNYIHLKQKLNRTIYCKVKNKEIKLSECSCCEYRKYKVSSMTKRTTTVQYNTSKTQKCTTKKSKK